VNGIELLYDYLEDHVRAAAVIRERKPLAMGVLCFVFGGVSLFVAQALSARLHVFGFSLSAAALAALWKVITGFVLTAVLHMIVEMSGKTGSAASLFVLFGLADLSWALAVPLVLIARAFGASPWVGTIIFLGIGILQLSLKARGLQDNYQLAPGRAWLTLSMPYLATAALVLVMLSLAVVGLVVQLVRAIS
jgi:hypothetical protein